MYRLNMKIILYFLSVSVSLLAVEQGEGVGGSTKEVADKQLLQKRIDNFSSFHYEEKITQDLFQLGKYLLNTDSRQLDDIARQKQEYIFMVADGYLAPDKLQRALDAIETPVQRDDILEQDAELIAERERQAKISELLVKAKSNVKGKNGKEALIYLDELLKLDPSFAEAMQLRLEVTSYLVGVHDVTFDNSIAKSAEAGKWEELINSSMDKWFNPYEVGKATYSGGEVTLTTYEGKWYLLTKKEYSNFIFEGEIKLPFGQGNSGISFRCHYEKKKVWGYHAEVDASARKWTGGLFDEGRRLWFISPNKDQAGGIAESEKSIAEFRARAGECYKQGKWNKIRIVCIDQHIQIFVNGVKTTDIYDDMDSTGHIGLQYHGGRDLSYKFRNLRIMDLGDGDEFAKQDKVIVEKDNHEEMGSSTKVITGEITDVVDDMAAISVGSSSGIVKNMRFWVIRGDKFLGCLDIMYVEENESVGCLTLRQGVVVNGDRVTNIIE